jgi:hypothetical protein
MPAATRRERVALEMYDEEHAALALFPAGIVDPVADVRRPSS